MIIRTICSSSFGQPARHNFTGEKVDRNQRSATVNITQPKATPDDAFGILGCSETLRDNENPSTRLVTQRRYLRRECTEEKAE